MTSAVHVRFWPVELRAESSAACGLVGSTGRGEKVSSRVDEDLPPNVAIEFAVALFMGLASLLSRRDRLDALAVSEGVFERYAEHEAVRSVRTRHEAALAQ